MELHFSSDELGDWYDLHRAIEEKADGDVRCAQFPDAFFPDNNNNRATEYQIAKQWCEMCPIQKECLAYSFKWEVRGTWGGLTEWERNQWKRRIELKRRAA